MEKYLKDIKPKASALYAKVPPIEEYEEILKDLQALSFITPDETIIEETKDNFEFIMDMVKEYPVVDETPEAKP